MHAFQTSQFSKINTVSTCKRHLLKKVFWGQNHQRVKGDNLYLHEPAICGHILSIKSQEQF